MWYRKEQYVFKYTTVVLELRSETLYLCLASQALQYRPYRRHIPDGDSLKVTAKTLSVRYIQLVGRNVALTGYLKNDFPGAPVDIQGNF